MKITITKAANGKFFVEMGDETLAVFAKAKDARDWVKFCSAEEIAFRAQAAK